jgi:hypothetical protein
MIFDKEYVLAIESLQWKNCSYDFIINMVFNNMFMTEYSDWLTLDHIDEFIVKHPNVYITGHGMQELILYSKRYTIASYLIDSGRANLCAKDIYTDVMK